MLRRDAWEVHLRAYVVRAVNREGRVIDVVTADTAAVALSKFQDAIEEYHRAWVCDEAGEDVSVAELMRRAEEEQPNSGSPT
jgi:hypothetical protein